MNNSIKNRKFIVSVLLAMILMLGISLGVSAQDGDNVTLTVLDSFGNPLSGVAVSYLNGYWRGLGNTNDSGQVTADLPAQSWQFKADYGGTSATQTQDVSVNATVTFYTSQATVQVNKHDSSALPSAAASYLAGYYRGIGNTDGSGMVSTQVFPGTFTFKADYGGTSTTKDAFVPGDGVSSGSSTTVMFYTSQVTVQVNKHDSSALPGAAASYLAGYYRGIGNTDGSGMVSTQVFPGTFTFKVDYGGTSATQEAPVPGDGVSSGSSTTVTFYTSQALVEVKGCNNTPVPGVAASYLAGYYRGIGNTDGSGMVSTQVFPGTFTFKADYGGTSAPKDASIPGDGVNPGYTTTITFNPIKVTLLYSGSKSYLAGYWRGFSGSIYMFPGTYTFKFDTYQQDITISGCEMSGSVLAIQLKDSTGAGVSGGKAYLGVGGWPYIGDTDANGTLVYFHDSALGNMRIRMAAPNCGGSQDSSVQDTAVNSLFTFQTNQVVIQLQDSFGTLTDGGVVAAGCGGWPVIGTTGSNGAGTLYHEHFAGDFKYRMSFNGTTEEQQHDVSTPFVFQTVQAAIQLKDHLGNPLDGGKVAFGIGGWPVIGTTGDGGPGQVTYQIFAGTYSFRMSYNHGTEEKQQAIGTPVVFQTALVSLQFGGTIQHGVGGWPAYTGPIEMLPIAHRFGLTAPGHPREEMWFTPAPGDAFERTIVYMKLLDSDNNGLAGGTATYYKSGWQTIPDPTDADGKLLYAIPGLTQSYSFKMSWAGYTQQQSNINVTLPANTPIIFQTVGMVVHLMDSQTAPSAGGEVQYYASGWKPFGTTGADGNTPVVELLPGSYSFKMSFAGYTQQQSNIDITATNPLYFQTVNMVVYLKNSGNLPLTNGVVQYYASGWKPFGTTGTDGNTPGVELLPGTYSFKMSYLGYTQQQSNVNIAVPGNRPLEFQTIPMVVRLEEKASPNNGIAGGVVQYYASGWKLFGMTDSSGNTVAKELLPGSYSFKMTYAGATEQKSNIDITQSGNNPLIFQTVNDVMSVKLVNSGGTTGLPGGVVQYYASGWKPFGTTDDNGVAVGPNLLPGVYSFKMTYAGYTQQKSNVDITLPENKPLIFETTDMVVQFRNSSGLPIEGGVVQYYASGWKDFGTTDGNGEASLLLQPGTYSFKMTYEGYTQQVSNVNIALTNPLEFKTRLMEVQLKHSSGAALSGGSVQYYASGWKTFGDVDGTGSVTKELLPGTYSFKMTYEGYTQQKSNVDITSENPLVYQTEPMVVRLQKCDQGGLAGGAIQYYASGWKTFGETGSDGNASKELLPGSYSFKMTWEGQTEQRSNVDITQTNPVIYQTTSVALQYPETIKYYASGWKTFTSPMELLPFDYTFKFGSYQTNVEVNGCALNQNVAILVLEDHLGKGMAGGVARGGHGSSYASWFVPGSTNDNGILFDFRNGSATTMSYEMRYNNTAQVITQDVTTNAVFEFQTDLVTMRLQKCDGTGLSGGTIRYGIGSTYTTWFFPGGSTNENGESSAELFPGTYSFEMGYQGTAESKLSVALPSASPLIWTTTNVTLQYSGQISYGGATGQSQWFTKPSMELLPGGPYTFHFQNPEGGRLGLSWNGCEYTQSVATLKLINSSGLGIAGASGQYYDGSWHSIPGSTDADGLLPFLIPGLKGNLPFALDYAYARQQKSQDIASDSVVVFQTQNVVVELRNSSDETFGDGDIVQYYSGGWHDIGSTSNGVVSIELLPLNYPFSINHASARQEKSQNVGVDPTVIFQTELVAFQLRNSGNSADLGGGAEYYSNGWHTFGSGTTETTMELLPLNYPFRVSYGDASQQMSQNVSIDPVVKFQTTLVTFQLLNSGNSALSGGAEYYANGWHTFGSGTTEATMELLPLNYPFRVSYGGASQQMSQDVSGDPVVKFQTVLVTFKLRNSNGTGDLVGVSEYYANGWLTFGSGTTGTSMELLPLNYPFRVSYGGASQQISQDVNVNQIVMFQTGQVHSDTNTCTQYYANGWNTFSQDMELLPGSYPFLFNDGEPQTNFSITGGTVNLIH